MVARLFVGNLPYSATEQTLRELFGEVGTVREVVLPTDRETGRPRGFGFVEMATEAEATAAIHRFEGHALDGRRLRVNRAEERAERGPRFPPYRGPVRPVRMGGRPERKPGR